MRIGVDAVFGLCGRADVLFVISAGQAIPSGTSC